MSGNNSKHQPQPQQQRLAPESNPDVGRPAIAAVGQQQVAHKSRAKTRIEGASLVPDIKQVSRDAGTMKAYRYWVGVTPSCPRESIDLAGVNFPKINERIINDPSRTGRTKRAAVIGSIVWLTEDKIQKMRERLPRTVIRFHDDKGELEEPGTGKNIGDNHVRPRRGSVITIPTAEDLEDRRKRGKPARTYTPNPETDVPAARFMFAQLCADQANGSRADVYPETLEMSGLEWPEELAAASK